MEMIILLVFQIGIYNFISKLIRGFQMDYKDKIIKLKNSNMFSAEKSFEEYIVGLRRRFLDVYGEILNTGDYEKMYMQLKDKGLI